MLHNGLASFEPYDVLLSRGYAAKLRHNLKGVLLGIQTNLPIYAHFQGGRVDRELRGLPAGGSADLRDGLNELFDSSLLMDGIAVDISKIAVEKADENCLRIIDPDLDAPVQWLRTGHIAFPPPRSTALQMLTAVRESLRHAIIEVRASDEAYNVKNDGPGRRLIERRHDEEQDVPLGELASQDGSSSVYSSSSSSSSSSGYTPPSSSSGSGGASSGSSSSVPGSSSSLTNTCDECGCCCFSDESTVTVPKPSITFGSGELGSDPDVQTNYDALSFTNIPVSTTPGSSMVYSRSLGLLTVTASYSCASEQWSLTVQGTNGTIASAYDAGGELSDTACLGGTVDSWTNDTTDDTSVSGGTGGFSVNNNNCCNCDGNCTPGNDPGVESSGSDDGCTKECVECCTFWVNGSPSANGTLYLEFNGFTNDVTCFNYAGDNWYGFDAPTIDGNYHPAEYSSANGSDGIGPSYQYNVDAMGEQTTRYTGAGGSLAANEAECIAETTSTVSNLAMGLTMYASLDGRVKTVSMAVGGVSPHGQMFLYRANVDGGTYYLGDPIPNFATNPAGTAHSASTVTVWGCNREEIVF